MGEGHASAMFLVAGSAFLRQCLGGVMVCGFMALPASLIAYRMQARIAAQQALQGLKRNVMAATAIVAKHGVGH
jgi:hypothetical protein